mmetsp:Transcript_132461/g.264327  ORF Transcript_132461/g.264327 Transcript_132461/m.264327 type:complete len:105 (-) Transcript_132461:1-315(-)
MVVVAGAQASAQPGVRAVRDLDATGAQAVAEGAEAEGEADPDVEVQTAKEGKFWCSCDISLLKQPQQRLVPSCFLSPSVQVATDLWRREYKLQRSLQSSQKIEK